MKLKENIESQIKQAMLSKNSSRLQALRGIKSAIMIAETEKGKTGELTPDRETEVLKREAKKRKDSAEVYSTNGRPELAEIELKELSVIEEFLPKQMTESEIEAGVKEILSNITEPVSPKLMGTLIKEFNSKYPGQDGKTVSTYVKNVLSQV